jgi:hypothetical protein
MATFVDVPLDVVHDIIVASGNRRAACSMVRDRASVIQTSVNDVGATETFAKALSGGRSDICRHMCAHHGCSSSAGESAMYLAMLVRMMRKREEEGGAAAAELMSAVLDHGGKEDGYHMDLFLWACAEEQIVVAEALLQEGRCPDLVSRENSRCLRTCILRGSTLMAEFVLRRGADPDASGSLALAVEVGDMGMCYLLLARGANPQVDDGACLVAAATRGGSCSFRAVELLLTFGAHDSDGVALAAAVRAGHRDVAELLILFGSPTDDYLLEECVQRNDCEMLELLVQNGSNPVSLENELLRIAMWNRSTEMVSLLIARGCDANRGVAQGGDSEHLWFAVVYLESPEFVRLLIDQGVRASRRLTLAAVMRDMAEISEILLSATGGSGPWWGLYHAILCKKYRTADRLCGLIASSEPDPFADHDIEIDREIRNISYLVVCEDDDRACRMLLENSVVPIQYLRSIAVKFNRTRMRGFLSEYVN